jgi:hypothetical protein
MLIPLSLVIEIIHIASQAAAFQRTIVDKIPNRFLYWPNRTISFAINNRGCPHVPLAEASGAIRRSFYTWSSPSCTDVSFHFNGFIEDNKTNLALSEGEKPDEKNLIVWHETWPPPGVSEEAVSKKISAITTIIYKTENGIIIDADIDLNGKDYYWTTSDDTTQVVTDIQNIITHEVGHLLGFDHATIKEATMHDTSSQGEIEKRTLHEDDQLAVCTVYPFNKPTPPGSNQGEIQEDVHGGCQLLVAAPFQVRTERMVLILFIIVLLTVKKRNR